MTIVFNIIMGVVGLAAGAFLLVQSMIILFFGIPFTLRLRAVGAFKSGSPLRSYLVWLITLLGLFALLSIGIYTWFSKYAVAYWVGSGFAVMSAIGNCGQSPGNLQDYLQYNLHRIDLDTFESVTGISISNKSDQEH
jgi:hypothetical protein